MVVVTKKSELAKSVKNKEQTIIVRGKLAKILSPLAKIKGNVNVYTGMGQGALTKSLMTAGAISTGVAITLIIVVGVVVVIAILLNYNVRVVVNATGQIELILERNKK